MQNDLKSLIQKIHEQQNQKIPADTYTYGYNRSQTQTQNRVKINFPSRNIKPFDDSSQNKNQKFMEDQPIDPWNTSIYNRQEDIKGVRMLLQSKKKQKKNTNNLNLLNRAAITSRSWNAERQRLLHLRKEMHMPSPIFETSDDKAQKGDILCYLRRKNQNQNGNGSQASESSKSFDRHRKLLSRIYSHSCEPKMLIKRITQQQQQGENVALVAAVANREQSFLIPSIKFKSRSVGSKRRNGDCYNFHSNGFRKLFKEEQNSVQLFKIKKKPITPMKKEQLQII